MQRQAIPGNSAGAMNGDGSRKALLHSTEGGSIGGAVSAFREHNSWPHKTVDCRLRIVAEHLPLDVAARSLQNLPGGADQTNKDGDVLIQYELVGTATNPASIGTAADLEWFGREVLGPDCRAMGVPLTSTVEWVAFPASFGAARQRLSPAAWDAYSGVLGHQHAPDNVHGDPGAIDIDRILSAARGDDDMDEATHRRIIGEEIAKATPAIAQKVHEQLNVGFTQSGSKIRTALGAKAEDGVDAALAEGHSLDARLDAIDAKLAALLPAEPAPG